MSTYKAAEFAKLAAVSVKTLQRWDRAGQLKPASRTPGNRRLYTPEQFDMLLNRRPKRERVSVADRRVSRQGPKPDSAHQKLAREQFGIGQGFSLEEWISEVGGGLNFKRPQFTDWVDRVIRGEMARRVSAQPDRLARIGFTGTGTPAQV